MSGEMKRMKMMKTKVQCLPLEMKTKIKVTPLAILRGERLPAGRYAEIVAQATKEALECLSTE